MANHLVLNPAPAGNVRLADTNEFGENGVLMATLDAGPAPSFWVNFLQAVESGYEPPPPGGEYVLVADGPDEYGRIGYMGGGSTPMGSLTPDTLRTSWGQAWVSTVAIASDGRLSVSVPELEAGQEVGGFVELIFEWGSFNFATGIPGPVIPEDKRFVAGQTYRFRMLNYE